MNKVLFDKNPIVVNTVLATKIGLNDAIVLQQIHYWLEINKENQRNFYEGKYWTYNTIKEWNKSFPFFGEKTLRRVLTNLEKLELLTTGNFNKLRVDRTKWYTINYSKLSQYMEQEESKFTEADQGQTSQEVQEESLEGQNDQMQEDKMTECNFPNGQMQFPERANASGQNDQMQEDKLSKCKGTNCPNASGQNDHTNTRDYTETSSEINSKTSSSSSSVGSADMKNVVEFFSNNFYPLQAYEAEVLIDWAKSYSCELVLEAMKAARKNNARSMRYMERTLQDWEDNGIKTIADVERYNKMREANINERNNRQNGRDSKNSNASNQYEGLGLSMSDLQ